MATIFQDIIIFDGFEVLQWSVAFFDWRITKIAKSPDKIQSKPWDEIISGEYFLMPGMINLHAHLSMSLFKSAWEDLPLQSWLNDVIFPLESKFVTSEMAYYASLWSMVECLRSGVTTVSDMYFFEEQLANAAKEINMKVFLWECLFNFKTPSGKTPEEVIDYTKENTERYKDDELIYTACAPHSPYLTDEKYLLQLKEISDKYDIPFHIHMCETKNEVEEYVSKYWKTAFERFNEIGLLSQRFIWAHCVHLTDNDLDILANTWVTVAHCPSSNMKLWSGIARIAEMLDKWINVAVATDGSASNNNLNLIQEVELAAKIQKWNLQNPSVFKAIDALKSITSNAWKPLWQYFWTIQVWAPADLVLINLSFPELYPTYDVCASILYASSQSDVESVYVNWKKIVDKWQILTIDVAKLKKDFWKFVQEVKNYLQ